MIALVATTYPPCRQAPFIGSFSIILAVRNEQPHIERRLNELTQLAADTHLPHEIIVVCDGCEDRTPFIARQFQNVHVLELQQNLGKSAALSHGAVMGRNDILLFADARQSWTGDTIPLLLENFSDPQVGAVSGNLVVESAPGVMAGVGLYWRFEKWLRRTESQAFSMVSVSGSIIAVRRPLFCHIPAGCLLDDVYWPLRVAMQGFRVVHDPRAIATDRLPDRAADEFKRKVRTLSGNFQLLALLPGAILPWQNPVWFQFWSHKLLRLVVPWALIATFAISCILQHPIYRFAFFAQLAFYALALLGLPRTSAARLKPVSAAASFLVLNTAALIAFCVFVTGRSGRSWTKVSYLTSEVGST